ncbi:MAG TPA: S24 family peptidase [Bryobacteraceae bacterium]|nr:S24 family peptidase [Bryobacteraceae bacterium]
MPGSVTPIRGLREGVYVLLEVCLPGRPSCNAGVLLLDPATGRGWVRFRQRFDELADPQDAEVLEALEPHFRDAMAQEGAEAWLRSLEDAASNAIRVSERRTVAVDAFTRALDRLYSEHVEPVAAEPYRTHLPLYSMRAAAGFLGEEMAPAEEDWVRAPEGMRLDRDMIVVHVVGHSMEPRIPDGSLNIFRLNPAGSRQGKILLIQRRGILDDTAGCTVKRYTSVKVRSGEDEWRHQRIRLEPLNPDYEAWEVDPEGFAVVGEWLRTIE